jgi:hypothetical protein
MQQQWPMVEFDIRYAESDEQDRNRTVGSDVIARHREDHSDGTL